MDPRYPLDVISQAFIASVYSPQYFDGNCSKFHHRCREFIIQFCLEPILAFAPQFYHQLQSPTVPLNEQYGGASTGLRVARPPVLLASYVQMGVVQFPGWSHYSVRGTYTCNSCSISCCSTGCWDHFFIQTDLIVNLSSQTSAFARQYIPLSSTTGPSGSSWKDKLFPERTGEPECQYYLITVDCKFGLACQMTKKYHHPRDHVVEQPLLSPVGLPLRPVSIASVYSPQYILMATVHI
ncbi:hypothetical protein VNO78_20773 [Psophocarpus tetragonolobus]|uniref:Uncharacterized protein n=1 Tax=Psophocarpus tetragonolobus TaxID=3891 RepID=A0AAN9SBJ9_PSOTE